MTSYGQSQLPGLLKRNPNFPTWHLRSLTFLCSPKFDIALFQSGKHFRLYEKMGAHPLLVDDIQGTYFSVYAPAAKSVRVIGSFNHWEGKDYNLFIRDDTSGIWEGFIPGVQKRD